MAAIAKLCLEKKESTGNESVSKIQWENEIIDLVRIPGAGYRWEKPVGGVKDLKNIKRTSKLFANYFVAVSTSSGYTWTVSKRFSQFFAFHKRLYKEEPAIIRELKLSLPRRKIIGSSITPEVIQHRRRELETYLNLLVQTTRTSEKYKNVKSKVEAFLLDNGNVIISKVSRSSKTRRKSSITLEETVSQKAKDFSQKIYSEELGTKSNKKLLSFTGCSQKERLQIDLEELISTETKSLLKCAQQILELAPNVLKRAEVPVETPRSRKLILLRRSKNDPFKDINPLQCLEMIQQYLEDLSGKLQKQGTHVLKDFKHTESNHLVYRECEKSLIKMHSLQETLLCCARACFDNNVQDQLFRTKVMKLKKIYEGFGIPPSLFSAPVRSNDDVSVDWITWGWSSCIRILNSLDSSLYTLPSEKVDCLMDCVREIHAGLAIENVENETSIGADDFLPVLIYITVNSNLESPFTTLTYMTKLASEAVLESEVKYWLTTFESAIYFVSNLEDDCL